LAGLERDPDRLLGLSSTLSLARLTNVAPAARRQTLREVAKDDLAFACLGMVASDLESSIQGREAWEILGRPLKLRRSIETWTDLSAALADAGLTLELQTDGTLGRLDQNCSLSGRDALAWLLGRFSAPVVVLEGRKVRLMARREAVTFWEKKLDGK
jgi:hypothetical protein